METPIDAVPEPAEDEIERGETGVRILYSLVFFIAIQVVEAVLAVVIVFELAFTLITRREPSGTVKDFAQRVLDYLVEVVRYLTYHDGDAPFPFREFPPRGGAGAEGRATSG